MRLAAALLLALPVLTACAAAASGARANRDSTSASTPPADEVTQFLSWGDIQQSRAAPADTLFIQSGRRLYLIGDIDGRFRDRSNPYDLYTFGRPLASDPDKYLFEVLAGEDRWPLLSAQAFTQTFAYAQFDYQSGTLAATRRDFVPQDQPVLFTTLTLRNIGSQPADVTLAYTAFFDLEDAWFTSLAAQRNQGQTVTIQGRRLLARARAAPDKWAVALGSVPAPDEARVLDASKGEFRFKAHLESGAESFGAHVVSLRVTPARLRFEHVSGPTPLQVTYQTPDGRRIRFTVEPGRVLETDSGPGSGEAPTASARCSASPES